MTASRAMRENEKSLTQEELKRQLSYDPQTGEFRRLVANSGVVKVGDLAGTFHRRGYVRIAVHRVIYSAHRLAFLYMTGRFPPNQIDHVDGVKSNNRWCNLRCVSGSENMKNRRIYCNNKSGTMGVFWDEETRKWIAQIRIEGRQVKLGYYSDKDEAIAIRKTAETEHGYHKNHGAQR